MKHVSSSHPPSQIITKTWAYEASSTSVIAFSLPPLDPYNIHAYDVSCLYHHYGIITSSCVFSSITCAMTSIPAYWLTPSPTIPCASLAPDNDRGDGSSESNPSHIFF